MLELINHFLETDQNDLTLKEIISDLYDARDCELVDWFSEEWVKKSTEDELREYWELIKEQLED